MCIQLYTLINIFTYVYIYTYIHISKHSNVYNYILLSIYSHTTIYSYQLYKYILFQILSIYLHYTTIYSYIYNYILFSPYHYILLSVLIHIFPGILARNQRRQQLQKSCRIWGAPRIPRSVIIYLILYQYTRVCYIHVYTNMYTHDGNIYKSYVEYGAPPGSQDRVLYVWFYIHIYMHSCLLHTDIHQNINIRWQQLQMIWWFVGDMERPLDSKIGFIHTYVYTTYSCTLICVHMLQESRTRFRIWGGFD